MNNPNVVFNLQSNGRNIEVTAKSETGTAMTEAFVKAFHESPQLFDVIADAMNDYAEETGRTLDELLFEKAD